MENIIIMKYGIHASEDVDAIIKRKQQEIKDNHCCFWGYGGTLLHPLNQVQSFCKNKKVYLLLVRTKSNLYNENKRANYYSIDNCNYQKIPKSVNVYGSKKALIFNNLTYYNQDINLNNYEVAIGNSKGKKASNYLKGRVDKGCFTKCIKSDGNQMMIHVDYIAELVYPYSVFLSEEMNE